MRIDELSGDSTITDVAYRNGIVSFRYDDDRSDCQFIVTFQSESLYSEAAEEQDTVHVRLTPLTNFLSIDTRSRRYLAGGSIASQMMARRQGAHLAIGLKADEYPLLLQVRGHRIVLACPLRSIDSVNLQLVVEQDEPADEREPG